MKVQYSENSFEILYFSYIHDQSNYKKQSIHYILLVKFQKKEKKRKTVLRQNIY